MKVYITYEETRDGGKIEDPDDRWSSRSDEHISYSLTGAYANTTGSWHQQECDLVETKPTMSGVKDVYVVLVRHSDGDTFGHSTGNGHIEGVYADEDQAMAVFKSIEDDTYPGPGYEWRGYFSSLESVNCYVLKLQDNIAGEIKKSPIRI
jgi:hypothetical protein